MRILQMFLLQFYTRAAAVVLWCCEGLRTLYHCFFRIWFSHSNIFSVSPVEQQIKYKRSVKGKHFENTATCFYLGMKTKSSSKLWKVGGKWFPQINVYKVVHQLLGVFLPLFSSSGWPEPESAEVATGHSPPLELETNLRKILEFTIREKTPIVSLRRQRPDFMSTYCG